MEAVKTFFMNKENYPMITMVLLGLTIIILLSCVMKSERFRYGRRQTVGQQIIGATCTKTFCDAAKLVGQSPECCKQYEGFGLIPCDSALATNEIACNTLAAGCMWDKNQSKCLPAPAREQFRHRGMVDCTHPSMQNAFMCGPANMAGQCRWDGVNGQCLPK